MTQSFDREMGEMRARMAAVETELQELRRDVREIRDTLATFRGGWKAVLLLVAVSASLGAAAAKLMPLLTGVR